MDTLYFDYNATTPVDPAVRDAMLPWLGEHYGNPSSDHDLGRACRDAIDEAREKVARLVGASSREIVFTSGGTESNNIAIMGVMLAASRESGHFVTSAMEHPAVAEPANMLRELGFDVTAVGCDSMGVVDPSDVARALRPDTRLVSVMHANNEIGSIQPIAAIGEITRREGCLLHTDAAQTIGKIPVDVVSMGVDLLSIAGHKLYAPAGVGALYVRSGIELVPWIRGAGHEGGVRPGTENVPYIVGLGAAAELVGEGLEQRAESWRVLRELLFARLAAGIGEGLTRNGSDEQGLPNTLSVNFPGVIGQELLGNVPELYASTGSACHSNVESRSDTQLAIGLPAEIATGTVRLSMGRHTTREQVETAARLLLDAWRGLAGAA